MSKKKSNISEQMDLPYEAIRDKLCAFLEEKIDTDLDSLWDSMDTEQRLRFFKHIMDKLVPKVSDEFSKSRKENEEKMRESRKEIEQLRKDSENTNLGGLEINLVIPEKKMYLPEPEDNPLRTLEGMEETEFEEVESNFESDE